MFRRYNGRTYAPADAGRGLPPVGTLGICACPTACRRQVFGEKEAVPQTFSWLEILVMVILMLMLIMEIFLVNFVSMVSP